MTIPLLMEGIRYNPNAFAPNTTAWVCPFCGEVIAAAQGFGVADYDAIEEDLAKHLTSRHPIRRRLSRKTRRAFRQRRANQAAKA